MKSGYKSLIIGMSLLFLLIFVSGIVFFTSDKIAPNISIDGMNVGGFSQEEALLELKENFYKNIKDTYIPISYENKIWELRYGEINFQYDFEEAVDQAYNVGRIGGIFSRYIDGLKVRLGERDIPIDFTYEEDAVKEKLDEIGKEVNIDPIDASIRLKSEGFVITDEKKGLKLNKDRAMEMLDEKIQNYDISTLKLPMDIIEAEIKRADLESISERLGKYSTKFNASNVDRAYNIKLATKSVTDVLVHPKEVFSLNETIGPRLAKFGYKTAKVIINNEYVDGIGGGICQVSSTLYNAALLANMKIVERKNHSLPSAYIDMGRDATISGDYIDLKFQNNGEYPVYIYGEVKGGEVKFSIYGKQENPNRSIKIKTEIVKKIKPKMKIIKDKTLPMGTEIVEKKPQTGYVVKSYRVVTENGEEVFTEPLFTDTYMVSDGVKRVGTKVIVDKELTNINLPE